MPQGTSVTAAHPILDRTVADLQPLNTRRETAGVLRCTPDYITELINAGELVALQRRVRKGSPILIPKEAIRAYLQRISR